MPPGEGITVMIALPMMVQFACYFGLARLAFGVPQAPAAKIAAVRVVLGLGLFWVLFLFFSKVGTTLAISSPIAWAMAARMDPVRSVRRGVAWVLGGTALTFAVNEAYWRLMMGDSVMSWDARWPFG